MKDLLFWLPSGVQKILDRFLNRRVSLYLVGGGVLRYLQNLPPRELDFVVEGIHPEELKELGGVPIGGPVFTHVFRYKGSEIEVTPIPKGKIVADLFRRDFTIHAMAISYPEGKILDPRRAREHLLMRLLVAHDREDSPFAEDPLRILRGFRRVGEGFRFHPKTLDLALSSLPQIKTLPPERIGTEISKLILTPRAGEVLRQFSRIPFLLGLLDPIFLTMSKTPPPPGHTFDPWTHSTFLLDRLPLNLPLRLGALFHDAGKVLPPGGFPEHERRSARYAEEVLSRWAVPRKEKERALKIIEGHSFSARNLLANPALLRAFYARHRPYLEDLLLFRKADRYASGSAKGYQDLIALKEALLHLSGEDFPFKPSDLRVDRKSLLEELKIPPAKRKIFLEALWLWVLEDPQGRNHPSVIEGKARELMAEGSFLP